MAPARFSRFVFSLTQEGGRLSGWVPVMAPLRQAVDEAKNAARGRSAASGQRRSQADVLSALCLARGLDGDVR